MERLGTPDRVAQGLAVLRVEHEPRIGDEVVDADLTVVGTVVDVFGPIDAPYAVVSPGEGHHPPALVGETLYVR